MAPLAESERATLRDMLTYAGSPGRSECAPNGAAELVCELIVTRRGPPATPY